MKKIIFGIFLIVLMTIGCVMGASGDTGMLNDYTAYVDNGDGTYIICTDSDGGYDTNDRGEITCGVYSKKEMNSAYLIESCALADAVDYCGNANNNVIKEFLVLDSKSKGECGKYPVWCVSEDVFGGACEDAGTGSSPIIFSVTRDCVNGCGSGECLDETGEHYEEGDNNEDAPTNPPDDSECDDGRDNDGDVKIDYNRGNGGCCDVDNDANDKSGKGSACEVKAYSDLTETYVDETKITKTECENIYGYSGTLINAATPSPAASEKATTTPSRTSFLRRLFGMGATGKAVDDKSFLAKTFGKKTDKKDTATTCDALKCPAGYICECKCVKDTTEDEVAKPKKGATWYDYDPQCFTKNNNEGLQVGPISLGVDEEENTENVEEFDTGEENTGGSGKGELEDNPAEDQEDDESNSEWGF